MTGFRSIMVPFGGTGRFFRGRDNALVPVVGGAGPTRTRLLLAPCKIGAKLIRAPLLAI
ncbi:hypothetical protein GF108_12345 [Phyllobacterium sp. SYP-B3895]|uniref:hypothetical protein n=1 Tax=Phyllobacterium sp. SYP-B3895 TaxID=2663240 RepID=UPI001299ECA0|nr:hypothetical protein [Phyllobacterium sp. SYP-B3895]